MLEVVETIEALRARVADHRRSTGTIGFVPTMGALHAGHASLIERARRESGTVVVSIFVNPLQFDRAEDLERYPRPLDADVELCRGLGVELVFAPSVAEMYPVKPEFLVQVGQLANHLCGKHRPGHFEGVATVVLKLFEIVRPDEAYFGEKDAQQLAVVRRMVTDFNVPVRIVGVPTVRERDGLALSSRNVRLNAAERQLAPSLYAALRRIAEKVEAGATSAPATTGEAATLIPADERLRLEYLELVDPDDFQPIETITGPVIAAGALWVGNTRLIDNVRCTLRARS
ncbi:MAG TPA: pantoate--beta-alanine ligase [Vicinamibacterales bacterium]|nr:pantoate--beta-alanine ligase [Vicinamibacterales bacterium]